MEDWVTPSLRLPWSKAVGIGYLESLVATGVDCICEYNSVVGGNDVDWEDRPVHGHRQGQLNVVAIIGDAIEIRRPS